MNPTSTCSQLLQDPTSEPARALLERDPDINAILHTNCVATLLSAGHATNALPQRATANVNCRIFPGTSAETVLQTLQQVIADTSVHVSLREVRNAPAPPPPSPGISDARAWWFFYLRLPR